MMLADTPDLVIGVDTHRDRHALAFVWAATGAVVAERSISADRAGHRRALEAAISLGPGRRLWAIEGTGAYGAPLTRDLLEAGEQVAEVARPARHGGPRGKSDRLDALRAARSVLGDARPGAPRAGRSREALRVLMVARAAQVEARARALTRIRALLVSAPEALRRALGAQRRRALLGACAGRRPQAHRDPLLRALCSALRTLGRQGLAADAAAAQHERQIATLVQQIAPGLLDEPGVGPISAAQLLLSWSHHGRLRSEAAFARLGGVAPIPASSGQVVRHRLDRGGDRQLNRALHQILLTRRIHDPATRAYIARRIGEGKTTREAIRCLKRYLARHLFRLLEALPQIA